MAIIYRLCTGRFRNISRRILSQGIEEAIPIRYLHFWWPAAERTMCYLFYATLILIWLLPRGLCLFFRSLAARRKRYKDLRRGLINLFYPRVALKPSFRLVATSRELERGFHALTALFGIDDDVNFPKRSARSDFSSDGDVVWRYISAEGNKGAEAKRTGVQIRHDKWAARIFRGETARDEGEGIIIAHCLPQSYSNSSLWRCLFAFSAYIYKIK